MRNVSDEWMKKKKRSDYGCNHEMYFAMFSLISLLDFSFEMKITLHESISFHIVSLLNDELNAFSKSSPFFCHPAFVLFFTCTNSDNMQIRKYLFAFGRVHFNWKLLWMNEPISIRMEKWFTLLGSGKTSL